MAKRYRGFAITLNNYNDKEYNELLEIAQLHSEKYIFGKEKGKEGTPHVQGYLYFKNGKTFNAAIKVLGNPRIHIEGAKGTPEQNWNYCSKDGDYVSKGFEYMEGENENEDKLELKVCPIGIVRNGIRYKGYYNEQNLVVYLDGDGNAYDG